TFSLVSGAGSANNSAFSIVGNTLQANASFNFEGQNSYSIRVRATDAGDLSTEQIFTITVTNVNEAPTNLLLSNDIIAENAGANAVVGNLSAVDVDASDTLTYTLVSGAGSANNSAFSIVGNTLQANASFNFEGQSSYSVRVRATDAGNLSTEQMFTIHVTNVNDAPTANADSYSINEDTLLTVAAPGVLSNDSDVEGDSLTASLVSGTANGSLLLNANGSFTYLPHINFKGTDSFTYRANDSLAGSDVTTVTITVNPVNDAPTANNDSAAGGEDSLDPITGNLLTNDSDIDLDSLTAVINTGPANGTLVLNLDGSFTYTANPDFNGTDSFSYHATDGTLDSNVATVTITVNAVNDAPVAANDIASGDEDSVISGNVLNNDTDIDTDHANLTAVLNSGPANGTLVLNPNGSFTYTPSAHFNGTDTFTYRATDGSASSNIATVTITIAPVNDVPVATNDIAADNEDTVITGNVLNNDTDADGTPLTAVLNSGPVNGTLVLNPDGSFTYTPNTNYNGSDSFSYHVSDGTANSNIATVSITLSAVNDTPVAVVDAFSGNEDSIISGNVLTNDSDVEGSSLTAILVSGPQHGTLTLNANGSFSYTPHANYNGSDNFIYKVRDGAANSADTTVTLTINPVNDAPVAVNDSASSSQNNIIIGNVITNDSDVDNDPLSAILVNGPAHGSVILNANGTFSYTPDTNYIGSDSFTYKVNDGLLDSNIATVNLSVTSSNTAPVVNNDNYLLPKETTLTIAAPGVLANDSDPEGSTLTIISHTNPLHGILVLNANGSFSYTPFDNYKGPDSFIYTVSDGILSSTATVNLTVVNSKLPNARHDNYFTDESTQLVRDSINGLLENDGNPNTLPIHVSSYTQPSHGTVTVNADGSFVYTPGGTYSGLDTFTYTVTDGFFSDSTSVNIHIHAVNDLTSVPGSIVVLQGSANNTGNLALLVQDATPNDHGANTFTLVKQASHGTVVIHANGTYTYTPDAGYIGNDSFKFEAIGDPSDRSGNEVIITVTPQIVINSLPITGLEGGNTGLIPVAQFSDYDTNATAGSFSATIKWGDGSTSTGTIVQSGDGTFNVLGQHIYMKDKSYTFIVSLLRNNGSSAIISGTALIDAAAPTDIVLSNALVVVGDKNGTLVGSLDAIDNPGDSSDFMLMDNANGAFKLKGDQVVVADSTKLVGGTTKTITVKGTDDDGLSVTKAFVISIADLNPLGLNDTYKANHNTNTAATITINALNGVLSNDINRSNNDLSLAASLISGPSHGQLILNSDGSFSYTANNGFSGIDTFSYASNDGILSSAATTVSINVNANPTLSETDDAGTYVEKSAPIRILPHLLAADSDNTTFDKGTLTISFGANATTKDALSIIQTSAINICNNDIFYNGTKVASFTGGANLKSLVITFNSNATAAIVSSIGSQVGFSTAISNTSVASRTINFVMTDGEGGTSNTVSQTIHVREY
ncbi:MAG: tandem-95 repeat protein, partial [Parachlamydiaceae bacterium]|nr:tandem-95 repeat protein [Parachlamydiaceae bacterium]